MTTNAITDPETGLRYYTWQGNQYPSVTSVRKLVGMPFTLHNWVVSRVVGRAVNEAPTLNAILSRPRKPRERVLEKNRMDEAKRWLRAAATEERDRKGDRGSRIHAAIDQRVDPHFADPDVAGALSQWHHFMASMGATILFSERQCFNLTYGYAGTIDALLAIGSRTLVVDYKSSNGVYLDHALQLIAYGLADFIGENDVIDTAATALLKAADGMAILHLADDHWELVEIQATAELLAAFASSLTFAKFLSHHHNSIEPLVISRHTGSAAPLVPHRQESTA